MPDPCPFCRIVRNANGEIDRVIGEKEHIIVILSNPRLMPGHTLVMPKRHVAALKCLRQPELSELMDTAIFFQEKIKRVCSILLGATVGCDLTQHDRSFMTQSLLSVPGHLHIHLRPRTLHDELWAEVQKKENDVFKHLTTTEELEELSKFQKLLGE